MFEESGASTAQERTQALYNQFYFTFPVCKCILANIKAVNDLGVKIHAILMDIYTLD